MTGDDYVYTDATGQPLYIVRRHYDAEVKKHFSQHKPDGSKGIDGIERVPYLLPSVRRAGREGYDVWIVEGEKDVHAAVEQGVIATTSSGGSGSWKDGHTAHLAGAAWVYIVADYDAPGYEHAALIVESIVRCFKKRLGFTVARARYGKDLSDHLAAGFGLDDLVEVDHVMLVRSFGTASKQRERDAFVGPAAVPQRGETPKDARYFDGVVKNHVATVRSLVEGARNRGVRDAAFWIGTYSHLAPAAEIQSALDAVIDAGISTGLPAGEAKNAAKSGFRDGVANPKGVNA